MAESSEFLPIVLVHGWGGMGDLRRDFSDADERDPYVGWNIGHRYNDPDGWVKIRDTQRNFEGVVLRLVKDYGYYDASNDEDLALMKTFLGENLPADIASDEDKKKLALRPQLRKSLWIFRYYEYNAAHLRFTPQIENELIAELQRCNYKPELENGRCTGVPRYAALLSLRIQQIVCPQCHNLRDWKEGDGLELSKVILVAHSMGGLIVRFALQYNLFGVRDNVARVLTMSTPHGGARYATPAGFLSWLPGLRHDDVMFLTPQWVEKYLGGTKPKAGALGKSEIFCLIGARHDGYFPGSHLLSRTDGIVHQDEAFLEGYPYSYVYNTHSGEFGIRENQDSYHLLKRYLFGDLLVKLELTHINFNAGINPQSAKTAQISNPDAKYFFQYFVKPFGINTHLNEISERAENQPQPRTLSELQARVNDGHYIIYDGYADSRQIKDLPTRPVIEGAKGAPILSVEHKSFVYDVEVGGCNLGSNTTYVPLIDQWEVKLCDQVFEATLKVEVKSRPSLIEA
jgi:pimeloyl-ACP methyl ester carboxylesterase